MNASSSERGNTADEHHRGRGRCSDPLADQVKEGACSAMMQGSGESYLSAFALHLHASPFQIGLLSALPPVIGTCSQLLSVKVLDRLQARKPLILHGAAAQALAWVPVFLLPFLFPGYGPWLLLASVTLYFAAGHLTVPAWNSLITDMVDADHRGTYFAKRAKVIAMSSFLALAAGGVLLHVSERWTQPIWGFAMVFCFAAAARLASVQYLSRLDETKGDQMPAESRGVIEFLGSRRSLMFRRFLVFSG